MLLLLLLLLLTTSTSTPYTATLTFPLGLDTARLILTKSGGDSSMLADVLCALADVSMFQVTCSRQPIVSCG
jgi:hypothetical protein